MAEIALLEVGVVEPLVSHGSASDRRAEDNRAAQDGEGREKSAEGPAADHYPVEVKHARMAGGNGPQSCDLILEHRSGYVTAGCPFPERIAAGGSAAVGHDDGEALLGEPLGDQVRRCLGQEDSLPGAAVGIDEYRQRRRAWPIPGRQQQGAADLPVAGPDQLDSQIEAGRFGGARDGAVWQARTPDY